MYAPYWTEYMYMCAQLHPRALSCENASATDCANFSVLGTNSIV